MVTLIPIDVYPPPIPIENSIARAIEHYGTPPCGVPRVVWESDAPAPADDVARALGGAYATAWVDGLGAPNCLVHIRSSWSADSCWIIQHEVRHLLGHAHSNDPVNPDPAGPRTDDGPDDYPWCGAWVMRWRVPFRTWDAADSGGWGF